MTTDDRTLHAVLGKFPWRRRKPRVTRGRALAYKNRAGTVLWAEPEALATFEDPGPALAYVALRGDAVGQSLARALIEHHAQELDVALSDEPAARSEQGLRVIKRLLMKAGLTPSLPLGRFTLEQLLIATWALGAAVEDDPC
ncbi:MAG: hypothetical protein KC636_03585 [Myxococcales bacterium]|nr:hypothetical protein [Myxococcales bacterium]